MPETYETIEAEAGSGGALFAQQQFTIDTDEVVFPVSIVGLFQDESTPPLCWRGDSDNGADVDVTRLPTGTIAAGTTGTAGTPSAAVVTVQGIANGTGVPVSVADGSDVALGAKADASASSDSGTFSLIALLKRLLAKITTQLPAALGGGAEAGALLVTVANDSTGVLSIDDNGTTVSVDDGGATISIDDGGSSITVDGSVSVTGEVDVFPASPLPTEYLSVRLTTGSAFISALPITDNGGSISIDDNGGSISIDDNGGSITVDGSVSITGSVTVATHDVTNAGTFPVQATLQAGTAAFGKLAANAGVTIGAVEIASAQTLGTVTTVSTVTTLTGGGIAHDTADSGNPVKIGAKAISSLKTTTLVASADRTDAQSDIDGAIITRPQFPLGDLISERVTNTDGSSTAFSNFGAVSNTRNVITSIVAYNNSATDGYIDFRDGTGGSVLFTVPIPAGGGAVLPAGATPYFRTTANTALAFDVSAALMTVYISISGFQSKV